MIKKFFLSNAYLLSFLSFIPSSFCLALPPDNPAFCASFQAEAKRHCVSSGLLPFMCNNMNFIYDSMIARFQSQQKACEYQKETSTKDCMDGWDCYRLGHDGQGKLCNSAGKPC
jgi:hypothetical protein